MKVAYLGYVFDVPWSDLDQSKTNLYPKDKSEKTSAVLAFNSGLRLWLKVLPPREFADLWATDFKTPPRAFDALFGPGSARSDYVFVTNVYSFTPEKMHYWSLSQPTHAREQMMLITKSMMLVKAADSGIFKLHSYSYTGFQHPRPRMSARIQRAILSVTDKTGLADFARKLSALGIELISTGGTAKLLRDSGIAVKDISELTGFPEMLDGRVKTLHPKVHGGILHRREDPKHVAAVAEHGIAPIDMVVVNLYAFEKTAAKPGVAFEELIENIDIGGPSMIRSAAKNFHDVAIVTSPADYDAIAEELAARSGHLSLATKWRSRKKPSPPPQPTIPPSPPRSSASAQTLFNCSPKPPRSRKPCASRSTKHSTCATAKIRTRKPPCTPTARAPA
jgi:hypothetical protein